MNRMQPNCNTYRGGLIVSKEKNKGNWDVILKSGEIVHDLDIDARKLKAGDWLVYREDAASDYGRKPVWEIMKADFFNEWMVVI